MEKSPAFQHYPKDMLSDSKYLMMSWEQRGIFRHLLDIQWLNGGLPVNPDDIAKMIGWPMPSFSKRVWQSMESCFPQEGSMRINPRLEKERKKQSDYRRSQSKKAKDLWKKKLQVKASHKLATSEPPIRHQPKNGLQSSSSSSSPIILKDPPTGAPIEKNPKMVDLRSIPICDLGEPAKHKLYNRVIGVFKARGWLPEDGPIFSVFRIVAQKVTEAKPEVAYPYFEAALMKYVNENADSIAAMVKGPRKRFDCGESIGRVMAAAGAK